jgi:hypothetical protein
MDIRWTGDDMTPPAETQFSLTKAGDIWSFAAMVARGAIVT